MAATCKFAILQAVPDLRRGERVNVGIVAFHRDRLDVRFSEIQKLRMLTGRDWEPHAQSYRAHALRVVEQFASDEDRLAALSSFQRVISPTGFGWLEAEQGDDYERKIRDILNSLVARPVRDRKVRNARINTEIAFEFRRHKILAKGEEGLSSHKVVRNLDFQRHKGLRADFVLKNGIYHVTATLDLRKENVKIDEACLKAVVLDKAQDEFQGDKRLFGVYAVPPAQISEFKDHIELLGDYADEIFNWEDLHSRTKYQHRMYEALSQSFGSN
jgi:hypothetical protein